MVVLFKDQFLEIVGHKYFKLPIDLGSIIGNLTSEFL